MDQVAAAVGLVLSNLPMPEQREPDVLTLAHVRAAGRVRRVAAWLCRSGDLAVLEQQTPFTCQSSAELWEYYQSLPLVRRYDCLVAYLIGVEFLEGCDILPRKRFPRLRRVLDAYAVALGAACLFPRKVFFQLHRVSWAIETTVSKRKASLPESPVPTSSDVKDALKPLLDLTGLSFGAGSAAPSGSSGRSWVPLLLISSLGVGAAVVWRLGADGVKQAALDWWRPPEPPTPGVALCPVPEGHQAAATPLRLQQ